MEEADLIITPQWLLTVNDSNQVLRNHSLVVNQGLIVDILPTESAQVNYHAEHRKLPGHILAPGLINAHMHMGMNLLRGYADDLPLMEWLENHIWPAEAKWVAEDFVADGSRLAIAESLLGGTTCVNDMYFFADVTAQIARSSGIRASIGLIVLDFPTAWASGPEQYLNKALALHDQVKNEPLISVALAPHAPYTVSRKPLEQISTLSSELDIPVHIHVHETAGEVEQFVQQHGLRPLQLLEEVNLLNPSLIAVHMTQLTDSEIDCLANNGVNIVHCPESNMKLASGGCPVKQLIKAGVNVALGTDSTASNNDLDMIGEMRSAALLGKHLSIDASAVDAQQTLRMATINGARALGLGDITGSLEAGKAADMIALDISSLSTSPVYDPVSHLVYAASREHIRHVWVAGEQLVNDRKLTTMDENEIIKSTHQWLSKIQHNHQSNSRSST